MAKHKHHKREHETESAAPDVRPSSADSGMMPMPVGPGYTGFGGSAGYSGSGIGGIVGGSAGAGYPGYSWTAPPETRHDDRIHDDICDRLSISEEVDASEVVVEVQAGNVTLTGTVENRHMKQVARDIAESVPGVSSVHDRLHVEQPLLEEIKEKLTPHRPSRAR